MRYWGSILIAAVWFASACVPRISLPESDERLLAAEKLIAQRRFDDARSLLMNLDLQYPASLPIWRKLADSYLRERSFEEAIFWLKRVVAAAPDRHDARLELWRAQLEAAPEKEPVRLVIRTEIQRLALTREKEALAAAYRAAAWVLEDEELSASIEPELIRLYPHHETSETIAKNALDEIGIERDTGVRLDRISDFVDRYPASRFLAKAISYELYSYAEQEDAERLRLRSTYWLERRGDDPRVLASVVGNYLKMNLDPERCVEWAQRALSEVLLGHVPFIEQDAEEDDRSARLASYRLLLVRALIAAGRYEEASGNWESGRREVVDNDNGAASEYEYFHGVIAEALDRPQVALKSYFESLQLGAPRARYQEEASAGLERACGQLEVADCFEYCRSLSSYDGPVYVDVTVEYGLSDYHQGRVAWGDYDGDGYDDLLLGGGVLLHNENGRSFTDATAASGLPGKGRGGIWADIDNDGDLDIFLMSDNSDPQHGDRLYRNQGDGRFRSDPPSTVSDSYPTEGAGWGDYDADGYVDLYVANYELPRTEEQPEYGVGTPDRLYHNRGNGRFDDVTETVGIIPFLDLHRCGRGVNWGDYDNDGDLDIFVSNYRLQENFLWQNDAGRFVNVALERGVAGTDNDGWWGHTIGSEWADFDHDGDLDLISANLAHPRYIEVSDTSRLLINEGAPHWQFTDRRTESGITYDETHSDPAWGDIDNDGDLDLFLTSIYTNERSYLYRNEGNGRFRDITFLSGTRVFNGWGCAFSDFDRDGDLDLVVGSGSGVRLLRHQGTAGHWLQVRIIGTDDNHAGIGARVTAIQDGQRQIREIQGGKGTASQHSLVQHFGFADNDRPVYLHCRFPSGAEQESGPLDVDQRVIVVQTAQPRSAVGE